MFREASVWAGEQGLGFLCRLKEAVCVIQSTLKGAHELGFEGRRVAKPHFQRTLKSVQNILV